MTPHNSRRKAREMALQALFQHNFHSDLDPKESVSYLAEKVGADSETHGFAHTLVAGVLEHKDEIDQLIQSKAQHWSLERMALVDLCLLRLAAFELSRRNCQRIQQRRFIRLREWDSRPDQKIGVSFPYGLSKTDTWDST